MQRDFSAPEGIHFRRPLWLGWLVHWFLPSTLHRPSRRHPRSQTECRPEERGETNKNKGWIKCKFSWSTCENPCRSDLPPGCVWRSRPETSPCGTCSGCSPVYLKVSNTSAFLRSPPFPFPFHASEDLTSAGGKCFLSFCLFLFNVSERFRATSLFIILPLKFPPTAVITVHVLFYIVLTVMNAYFVLSPKNIEI